MATKYDQFAELNDITNIVTFTISSIAVSAFIFKFGFLGLDTSAMIILFTYSIKNAFSIFVSPELFSLWDFITPVSRTAIFAALLYFILEMSYIRAAIEEENLENYQKKKQYIKKVKFVMFFLLLAVYFPTNMVLFALMQGEVIYMSLVAIRCVSKFIVDMYMFPLFLFHLMFFAFRKRQEIYKRTKGLKSKLTIRQKAIIVIIIINWFLKFVDALANIFIYFIHRYSILYFNPPSERINVLYLIFQRTYPYFVDFMNMMALLYLFVTQAQLVQKLRGEEKNPSSISTLSTFSGKNEFKINEASEFNETLAEEEPENPKKVSIGYQKLTSISHQTVSSRTTNSESYFRQLMFQQFNFNVDQETQDF